MKDSDDSRVRRKIKIIFKNSSYKVGEKKLLALLKTMKKCKVRKIRDEDHAIELLKKFDMYDETIVEGLSKM